MPLAPIKMTPAYRYGEMTPWGGDALQSVFHKPIPDARTGEALEVSCIKDLCSCDEQGTPLNALIAQYGEQLTGTRVSAPFPLLLKLLSAREKLSVQVHPDDVYASRVENKLGKTEAWVILSAEADAKIVYGIKPGVTKEALSVALMQGAAVEGVLNYVPAKAGDVFYIPAGMVHAIGEGILLYEIQQSSDVTYRFYDWERMDKNGNKRELHIKKALDVTNLDLHMDKAEPVCLMQGATGRVDRLLEEKYFSLNRISNADGLALENTKEHFKILTAIKQGTVRYADKMLQLVAGETALLPAFGEALTLHGEAFLLAFPTM